MSNHEKSETIREHRSRTHRNASKSLEEEKRGLQEKNGKYKTNLGGGRMIGENMKDTIFYDFVCCRGTNRTIREVSFLRSIVHTSRFVRVILA